MYLKCSERRKNGKLHRSWSIVEACCFHGGGRGQRHVLYLGEINDSQQAAWQKSIAVLSEGESEPQQVALFPSDRVGVASTVPQIQIYLDALTLHRPRQWGACWLALEVWSQLGLDEFWRERLARSRKGTRWDLVLTTLAIYRWLSPGSEWRLHREWFERSALGDLLGQDCRLAGDDTLYRCHDRLLAHKADLFRHLQERWRDLFNAQFDVLLYDLTSTYFESDPPESKDGLRRFGYSRDKRSDCVQVVIALIVTPEGFPLGYEVLSGNTADNTTLQTMLEKIEKEYGKAERTWLMDRGIPTEEALAAMRTSTPPTRYLVGTPKGRLSKLEQELAKLPWHEARPGVSVKLLPQEGELYVFAQSDDRIAKERSMRRRRLKKLWARLRTLQNQKLTYKDLLMKLGAAKSEAGHCWRAVEVALSRTTGQSSFRQGRPKPARAPPARRKKTPARDGDFHFLLKSRHLRQMRQREGRYLLRSNLARDRSRRALAALHHLDTNRRSLQNPQRRLGRAPDLPSERPSHRGPHLHRLSGLLPPCHPGPTLARPRARTDAARRARKVRLHQSARRASANHGWPHFDAHPPHSTRSGDSTPPRKTQAHAASATAAENHRASHFKEQINRAI